MPVVLAVSPHPDDEILGAGATLMALRDHGWRVVNLACGLGRRQDHPRRRAELTEACERARFELVVLDELGRNELPDVIATELKRSGAGLVVGPSPHDGHPAHELAGRALRDAIESGGRPIEAMLWGLWGELPLPNVFVPFDAARLGELQHALRAHAGELERNRFATLLESRAAANAVLGPERVFGFGTRGSDHPYAELLTAVRWSPEEGWRLFDPRELDLGRPLGQDRGRDVGWWLHAPSAHDQLAG